MFEDQGILRIQLKYNYEWFDAAEKHASEVGFRVNFVPQTPLQNQKL